MTGSDAAPAPAAERDSRNLLMRVIAALVLAPTAIAVAWVGGWPWAGLVTMAAIGLYVEWLMIVGAGRNAGVIATGTAALSLSGFCLASGRIEAALVTVVLGVVSVAFICPGKRAWGAAGFCYAAAALVASSAATAFAQVRDNVIAAPVLRADVTVSGDLVRIARHRDKIGRAHV